jgi:hypothetical protein
MQSDEIRIWNKETGMRMIAPTIKKNLIVGVID